MLLTSRDGYCSLVRFDPGELGEPLPAESEAATAATATAAAAADLVDLDGDGATEAGRTMQVDDSGGAPGSSAPAATAPVSATPKTSDSPAADATAKPRKRIAPQLISSAG